ncbi:hypothetical protein OCK02_25655 [Rhizobium sp. TRM96647]|uniref:hypothetical protein n=1 Tax=unclassified Rhizobium TaxID=2613769 RepID=UPI0021E7C2ED|nr:MULTISPECIES: hypothetical protein [unclassified Rhizobium]MCV3739522.1 hypothetical protein [Rhizobium sp. TRM96647]MCV3761214.1 hypothetical protein [Rhizobium sp. TRM96650]
MVSSDPLKRAFRRLIPEQNRPYLLQAAVEDSNDDRPLAGSTRTFSLAVAPVTDAPALVATQTLRQISEDASIASARKVATLSISDPNRCSNKRGLAGSDAKPRQ